MKKIFALILTSVLILSSIPTVFAAYTSGKYIVTSSYTCLYSSPDTSSQKLAEIPKNTYLDISQIRNDEFGKTVLSGSGVSGWVKLQDLKFAEKTETDDGITGIFIYSYPSKRTYTDGEEELNLTGLKVHARYKNGSSKEISGYKVYAPEMKNPEEKTVTVTYSPDNVRVYSASFTVTVVRVDLKGLTLSQRPKTEYLEHEKLDLSGLTVKTLYNDSSKDKTLTYSQIKNDPDYTITGCHGEKDGSILSKGTHTFTVTCKYSDICCNFTINVKPRKLISLEIKQFPDSLTVYSNKEKPAIDGLILKASYDNGETEDIYHYDCKVECNPSQFIIGPGNKVKVYFGELFVTLEFRYSISEPQKIVLEFPKDENGNLFAFSYLKGEPIDLSGIKVRLVYTDDTYKYVTDFKISEVVYTQIGSQQITVKYDEFSEVFSISITPYYSKGDITGDGEIKAGDARQALRASVGLTTLSGMTFFAADANRDGKITAADARLILRASVGLENLYLTL